MNLPINTLVNEEHQEESNLNLSFNSIFYGVQFARLEKIENSGIGYFNRD